MKKSIIYSLLLITLYAGFIHLNPYLKTNANSSSNDNSTVMPLLTKQSQFNEAYSKLPLSFEANNGQVDSRIKFLSRCRGFSLFLTSTEANVNNVVCMKLIGANPSSRISGLEPLSGKSNYFIGNNPQKWHTDVPNYAKVEYEEIYPGIDLVYYGNQQRLEYDFIVAPDADHKVIKLAFHGADKVEVNDDGDLLLHTADGKIIQHKPIVYQNVGGEKRTISGSYAVQNEHEISFQVEAYDSSLPLVIDPVLSFATYVGGSGDDYGDRIAVDKNGNIYVTGETESTNLPTTSPFQGTFGGEFDAFVIKLNAAGNMLIYSTYLGGSKIDYGNSIAVDVSGSAYITGYTESDNFPTKNAVYGKYSFPDGFVTKLNPAGNALVYSTYYGGDSPGSFRDIALDAIGNVYVVGDVRVINPPGRTYMVGKLDATGSRSIFLRQFSATYSYGKAITVDTSGNIYIAIYDDWDNNCFIMKLNPNGIQVFSKSLSGSDDDECNDITVDNTGNTYVTGTTKSTDFPTKNPIQAANGGGYDAFVTKFDASGTRIFSTYLGGSGTDEGIGIASDNNGNAYISGSTSSINFPTANPLQAAIGGGTDAFVAKLNTVSSNLVYSTYLGGGGFDTGCGVAFDSSENVYVTGYTASTNFPTANPLQAAKGGKKDIFIVKIAEAPSLVNNDRDQLPAAFELLQSYPNPFNSSTTIEFALPKTEYASLKIYNIRGEEMATLMEGNLPSGRHKSEWNASGFSSGVYFYTLKTESFFESKKLIIIK